MPKVCVEPLEPRCLLTGVTVIAHGYGGNVTGWVSTMADAIAAQAGALADQPRYRMTVTDPGHDGGPLTVASTRLGPAPASWGSRDIVVVLDWSDVAGSFPFGYYRNTFDVGAAVATKLLGGLSIPDLAAPLAELPMHFIGHSRGASLISEIARGLGQRGVWVDQLTYNDPHPVDGINDPLGIDYDDAPMRVHENVQFADNYWRTDGGSSFDFTGEAVNGAYNLQLSESILSGAGYSGAEHSDTHLWYHGTIGPPYQNSDGEATVGANWYNAPQGPRDQTGWRYSRLGEGARPASGLKSSGAHRDAVPLTVAGANVWDNIAISNLLVDATVSQGAPIAVNTAFEDRSAGGLRDSTITVGFDRDDNPFNGVFGSGVAFVTSSLPTDSLSASLPTTGVAGSFRVYAKISNGTNTRYYYAPGRQVITVPGYEKTWIGAATGDWSVGANWSSAGVPTAGDRVAIFGAEVELDTATTIAGLLIGGAGALDLNDNDLVINYSSVSPVGTWTGSAYDGISGYVGSGAIRSSAIGTGGPYAIGVAEAFDALGLTGVATGNWSGQSVDSSSVLIKFTYGGDANLSGNIDIDDYTLVDANASLGGILAGWFNGDFDFNGVSDIDDYTVIDSAVGIQGPPL